MTKTKKHSIGRIILFVVAVLCIVDTLFLSQRSGGKDLGIILPMFGGICIILGLLFTKTSIYKRNISFYRKIGRVILVLFTVWLISFVIISTIIVCSAISDKDEKVDSVLVLGAGLKGEAPTLVLVERLNYATDYLKQNPDVEVIVSGGQGPGESITEALAMERYLIANGIQENRIIKEEAATSTYENLIYSKQIYEQKYHTGLNKIMIVTSDFHMFRSKFLAKRVGLEPYGISSSTPWYIYPNVFLREYFAVFKSLVLDR